MAATENQAMMVLREEGAMPPIAPPSTATPPAFFVILKPGQVGDSGREQQGILVTNQEANMGTNTTPSITSPALLPIAPKIAAAESTGKTKNLPENLPPESICKGVKVTLDNNNMWNEFYRCRTEMILTKQGRRMFPYCRFRISGMEPFQRYILVMDITPVDNSRYKWNGRHWEVNGKAEPHVLGRVFIHPESPSSGHYWMQQPVSFYKLKLTNNTLDQEGHVILHSMHRYLPRLHIVPADKATEVIQLNGPDVMTFTFPQTEFFAVTAYQNLRITQLKIDYNPFAKGFREDGQCYRPIKPKVDSSSAGGLDPKPDFFPALDLSKTSQSREDVKPHRKTLKSLFGTNDTFDEVMDQELFSSEAYDIGLIDNNRTTKSNSTLKSDKDTSHRKHPRTNILANLTLEGNVKVKKEVLDSKYQSGSSEPVHKDSIVIKQEEGEILVDDRGFQKEQQKDSQAGVAKAKVFTLEIGKPVVCIKSSDSMGVASIPDLLKGTSSSGSSPPAVSLERKKGNANNTSIVSPTKAALTQSSETLKPQLQNIPLKQQERPMQHQKQSQQKELPLPQPRAAQVPQEKTGSALSKLKLIAPKPSSSTNGPLSPEIPLKSDILVSSTPAAAPNAFKVPGILQTTPTSGKKRRQRKVRFGKVGKSAKKSIMSSSLPVLGGPTDTSMQPDLEDVEGVLFVSFPSKEALLIHLGDQPQGGITHQPQGGITHQPQGGIAHQPQGGNTHQPQETPETPQKNEVPETMEEKISCLEIILLKDLKRFKHRQVIHPVLQEVGLKLNFVDPSLAIDLKYLGVSLPLPPPVHCTGEDGSSAAHTPSPDGALPFISRTGKTNDFTKIKGWREKFNVNSEASSSKNEGSGSSEGALKNRSAFCSDMLDEYLENEGKLIDERAASFSASAPLSPVVYQLPTKSTSYVRTLDSVLKKQAPPPPLNAFSFKPFSPPKKPKAPPKPKASPKSASSPAKAKGRSGPGKSVVAPVKQPPSHAAKRKIPSSYSSGKPAAKSKSAPIFCSPPAHSPAELVKSPGQDLSLPGALPVKVHLKQDASGRPQPSTNSRVAGMSKSLIKLMDLEDGALWEGKGRTYITEERAEVALASLLTAQGTLKGKPISKIIKRRAPPCLNDFCRLGCVCTSLAQERRHATHCRKPECMFGCTCLKRKVVLVKIPSKRKKSPKSLDGENLIFYNALEEEEEVPQKHKKKKKKRIEYTISEPEPDTEPPVRVYSLWNRKEGEIDPEPVFIPKPSVSISRPSGFPKSTGGPKGYTPRPNPVIRDEDKDPVYLYFESMMTCARVREYVHKHSETQPCCPCKSRLCSGKEDDPYHRFMETSPGTNIKKLVMLKEKSAVAPPLPSPKSQPRSPPKAEPTKLLEILSECNWEQERDRILRTLSQHMAQNSLARSFKVGCYLIELVSQTQKKEGSSSVITSTIRISLPSGAEGGQQAEESELGQAEQKGKAQKKPSEVFEMSSGDISKFPAEKLEKTKDRLSKGKALPFYTGISPAGILTASKKQPGRPQQGLIKVNGKSYPQAKLLLGQMGALHPANRLAAYITGRLRPISLDVSSVSSAVTKNSKELPAGKPPDTGLTQDSTRATRCTQPPARSATSTASSSTTTVSHSTGSTGATVTTSSPKSQEESPRPTAPVVSAPGGSIPSDRRPGTRLLLIPVQPSAPAVRPVTPSVGPPLPPGQRMVLQPVRSSSGATLFRHPNGQLIQLVPLSQLRAVQPNIQNLVIRNPGSVIRLPAPQQPASESALPGPAVVTGASLGSPVTSPTLGPKTPPASGATPFSVGAISPTPRTGAPPSFVGRTGTYTLRISPPTGAKVSVQGQDHKLITYSSGSQLPTSTSMLPLQSGGFTLLQVPTATTPPAAVLRPRPIQPAPLESQDSKTDTKAPQEPELAQTELEPQQDKEKQTEKAAIPAKTQDQAANPAGSEAGDLDTSLQDVTPAGVVSSDHSYTSGRDPLDDSKSSDSNHSDIADKTQDPEEPQDESLSKPLSEEDPKPCEAAHKRTRTVLACDQSAPVVILSGSSESSGSSAKDLLLKSPPGDTDAEVSASQISLPLVDSDLEKSGGSAPGRPASESKSCDESHSSPSVDSKGLAEPKSRVCNETSSAEEKSNLEEGEVEGEEGDQSDTSEIEIDVEEEEEEDSEDDSEEEDIDAITEDSDVSEEDEAVDIETVEELSEKINIARMKAVAVQMKLDKVRSIHEAKKKATEMKLKLKLQSSNRGEEYDETGASSSGRINHTVNERRRRSELRELFENMKKVLGLQHLPKASKFYILRQAHNEIQALVDQSDRLEAQKNLLTRKRAVFIKKIAQTSGKTEDLIIKKLEYICAKQKSLDMQKKKLSQKDGSKTTALQPPPEPAVSLGSLPNLSSPIGRPLILSRRRSSTPKSTASPGSVLIPETSASLGVGSHVVPTAGQIVNLKTQVPAVSPISGSILQSNKNSLMAKMEGIPISSNPGIASVTIKIPAISLPIQVKNCLPETSLPVSSKDFKSAPAKDSQSVSEVLNMPQISNVTSLMSSGNTAGRTEKQDVFRPVGSPLVTEQEPEEGQAPTSQFDRRDVLRCPAPPVLHGKVEEELEEGEVPGNLSHPVLSAQAADVDDLDDDERGSRTRGKGSISPVGDMASSQEEEDDDEDEDPEDETLTSLLNEIVFLNQQMNNDSSGAGVTQARFAHRSLQEKNETEMSVEEEEDDSKRGEEEPEQDDDRALSPLFLQLDEDLNKSKDSQSDEDKPQAGESDLVNVVVGSPSRSSTVANGHDQQSPNPSLKGDSLTPPPLLQMKTGSAITSVDTSKDSSKDIELSWRPMPRLAPLGLKVSSNPCLDGASSSAKQMKGLAPINLSKDGAQSFSS
ncbi:MGAP protein, partial [Amia calva]|nr:MGAP protein [Amia calva]